jgi:hypothetical protein
MLVWILLAIAAFLLVYRPREHLVVAPGEGTPPAESDPAWKSKVDAQIPMDGNPRDYFIALTQFFATIYRPARSANPTAEIPAARVEEFLASQPATINKNALRQMIISGFAVDRGSAQGREEKQLVTTGALAGFKAKGGSEFIEPKDGVLETWKRDEASYVPADPRLSTLSEGIYAPLSESSIPRREGQFPNISASWTGARPYTLSQNVQ